jgi:hypothetical protein
VLQTCGGLLYNHLNLRRVGEGEKRMEKEEERLRENKIPIHNRY